MYQLHETRGVFDAVVVWCYGAIAVTQAQEMYKMKSVMHQKEQC